MKKIMTMVLVLVMLATLFTACAKTEEADSKDNTEVAKKVKIGVSMDSLESAFWVANVEAMRAKAEEMGVEYVEVIAEGDANKQNDQIKNLIAQGVDAIVCAPKDGAAIMAAVKECKAAGIPIIMNNRPVQGDVEPDLTILSDNTQMAIDVTQWFVDKAKADGKTYNALLLIGDLADENAIGRKDGHMKVLEANTDVITVVQEVPTEWNHEVALKGLQNAFQANPEIDLIITPSDFLFPPIKSSLEQIDRWKKIGEEGHVAIVSFDGDENGMQYMKDGYNWCDAAQAAVGTGELSIEWAVKLAGGEKPASNLILDPGVVVTLDNFEEVKESIWGWAGVK